MTGYRKNNIGNKANNLIWLKGSGFPVPEFKILYPEDFILHFTEKEKQITKIINRISEGTVSVKAGREEIKTVINNSKIQRSSFEIGRSVKYIFRTSSQLEDKPNLSFAGIYESFGPYEADEVNIGVIIKRSWQSLYKEKVFSYLRAQKQRWQNQKFTIIAQKFYSGLFAGVAFVNQKNSKIYLAYNLQWAKSVVDGENSQHSIIEDNDLTELSSVFGEKVGIKNLENFIKALMQITHERHQGQDIEWSIKKDDFAILQTRDITVMPEFSNNEIYDCTNISESYPGVTLPLTFSFIQHAYAQVYKNFLILIGLKQDKLELFETKFSNLLAHIRGRVYYRVLNWYALVKLLPGYRFNKEFFESMWNPKEKLVTKKSKLSTKRLIAILPLALNFSHKIIFASYYNRKFSRNFSKNYEAFNNESLENKNISELLTYLYEVQNKFFSTWSIPILNDFRVMIYHGLIHKIIKKFSVELNGQISKLLTQNEALKSLQPLARLEEISGFIKKEKKCRELFFSNLSDGEILTSLSEIDTDHFQKTLQLINSYLKDFGDRNPGELKLESATLRDNPGLLIALIKKYLKQDRTNKYIVKEIDINYIKNKFRQKYGLKSFLYWLLFKLLLKNTKHAIADREKMRLMRSQAYNIARQAYINIGRRLKKQNIIKKTYDIFYLKRNEIESVGNEKEFKTKIKKIITIRRQEYELYKKEPDPPRRLKENELSNLVSDSSFYRDSSRVSFTGIAASPGLIQGEALCLAEYSSQADFQGKILITKQTDPGWTIVFPLIKGLITERGNMLSHAAIVSRELGLPSVVGVETILKDIKTGDLVELNGNTGVVKKII